MIIKKIQIVFVGLMCLPSVLSAQLLGPAFQIGINDLYPQAILSVKGASADPGGKTVQILNSANRDLFSLFDDGKLGLGQSSPSVDLDLRGISDEPIVAIGTTDRTASSVKGGVIRYMPGTKEIHYSDGSQWFRLEAALTRPCVVAPNDFVAGSYPGNTTTRLTGYVSTYDSHNTFDQATSVYTAPVDGLYVVSFALLFDMRPILADTYLLGSWVASNGRTIKCIQSYPTGGSANVGILCSGTIQLGIGDTVYPEIWHNMSGAPASMRVSESEPSNPEGAKGFNLISIFAQ